LGVVTHTLARQLGGTGAWQPTVGLSMLITSITDAPRLLLAMFAGGDATFVQMVGWATWVAGGALLTVMVSRSHDLPSPNALGAPRLPLIAPPSRVGLGTLCPARPPHARVRGCPRSRPAGSSPSRAYRPPPAPSGVEHLAVPPHDGRLNAPREVDPVVGPLPH